MGKKVKNIKDKKQTEAIIKVPISKFIDVKFREYALYVLESRGIPSFYDGMVNVQRYILNNAPSNYAKTLTVVGSCISDFYHHGDASVGKAISRMARPFSNSTQLLEGYGYLGTEVQEQAAAPRYTSVRISPSIKECISKYKHLNTREVEGPYHHFWVDCPIGLAVPIVGIAVGYKSIILPRKLDEIRKFINGNRKADLTPYFANFNGTVKPYNSDKSWVIQSKISVDGNDISVTNIPPIMKYNSVIKRLDHMLSKYDGKFILHNNSKDIVDIKLRYKGDDKTEFNDIINIFNKVFSVVVNEIILFVKDGKVLEYDSIKDYLTDWKWQLNQLKYRDSEYKNNYCGRELDYNKVKVKFISYMVEKKRTVKEIEKFYKGCETYITERLDRLNSKCFTSDEIYSTEKLISKLELEKINLEKEYIENKEKFLSVVDPTLYKSVTSKRTKTSLFDISDVKEANGVIVWGNDNEFDEYLCEEGNDEEINNYI